MSAELLEKPPVAPVLVAAPDPNPRGAGDGLRASRLTLALVEEPASDGYAPPDATSLAPPDSGFALAIARAMGVVVVTAHGPLDAAHGALLQSVLADLIEGQGNLKVIVDLHDVEVVDPSSLGGLVASAALAARRGGNLTFADPCAAVAAGLEASGLSPAVVVTHHRRLHSLSPPSRRPDDGELRRVSMAQHPAGADGVPHTHTMKEVDR